MHSGPTSFSPPAGLLSRSQARVCGLAIFCLTFAAYAPALQGELQWDDPAHLTAPALQGAPGLWKIWFRLGTTQQYYPLLHTAFWLEHRAWGDAVLGYHVLNVALHATVACLFALTLGHLSGGVDNAGRTSLFGWLAAAVFALHPVGVESVAWISEQKNTLSAVFYLASALAYLRFDRDRGGRNYALALGLFVLALLSKSVTATLPAALLLALAWRRVRLAWRRDAFPLLPLFAIGAASGLFTAWVERTYIGAHGGPFELTSGERCLLAARNVWFYLGKLFWPANLSFIYPRWTVAPRLSWDLGALGLLGLLFALVGLGRRTPAPLFAFLFYVGSLFPALGFFNVYPFLFSYVADHWQYLPSLGVIALVVEGGTALAWNRLRPRFGSVEALAAILGTAAGSVLAVLFVLTWRQAGLYRTAAVLYADTLAKNPSCWMAQSNLGALLTQGGSPGAAALHLREAIRLKPDYSDAHNNLGNALAKIPGHSAEAVEEFQTALRLEPGMRQAEANLGALLVQSPDTRAAGASYLQAALQGNEDNPEYAQVHAALGKAWSADPDRLADALAHLRAAVQLDPNSLDARTSLGVLLSRSGSAAEAALEFETVLKARPDDAAAHNNLGSALMLSGRPESAREHFETALQLDPSFVDPEVNLGVLLRGQGDGSEAVGHYLAALRLQPDLPVVRNSLASVYLRLGRTQEAVSEYEAAIRLQPGQAVWHNNLGIALTHAGRLREAVAEFRRALQLSAGYSDAHYNLGVALGRLGFPEEADREFSAAGRPAP